MTQKTFQLWKKFEVKRTKYNKNMKSFNNFGNYLEKYIESFKTNSQTEDELRGCEARLNSLNKPSFNEYLAQLEVLHTLAYSNSKPIENKVFSKKENEISEVEKITETLGFGELYPYYRISIFLSDSNLPTYNLILRLESFEKYKEFKITNFENFLIYVSSNLNTLGKIETFLEQFETLKFLYAIETYNSMNFKEREKAVELYHTKTEKEEKPKAQKVDTTTVVDSKETDSTMSALQGLIHMQATIQLDIKNGDSSKIPIQKIVEELITKELVKLG